MAKIDRVGPLSRIPGSSLMFLLGGIVMVSTGCQESPANSIQSQGGQSNSLQSQPYYHAVDARPVIAQKSYTVTREFVGTVVARQNADLGFELSGKLAALHADEGDHVTAGSVLARLDTELLQITRAELEAQIKETEANLTLTKANLARQQSLSKKGYASEQRLDELTAEQQALRAALDRLRAAVQANEMRIRKSSLLAPFDGSISRRFVDEGVVVTSAMPVLRLLQKGAMEARIGVPTRLLADIELGKLLQLRVGEISLDARVIALGSDVDLQTRTVPVRLALPEGVRLVDGELAYLRLDEGIEEAGFWVPMTALTDGLRGLWNVYALKPTDKSDVYRLERRDVQISYASTEKAYVTGALADGELIVGAGTHRLAPGQEVRRADRIAAR